MSLLQQCHRLLDELSAGTQLCPTNILSDATLNQCKEWQSVNTNSNTSQYNCTNDKYLESLQPGQYQGIVASYLSFNTDVAISHFRTRATLFEQCTGGKIQFAEGNDISGEYRLSCLVPPPAAAGFRSPIGVAVCRHSFAEPKLLLFVDMNSIFVWLRFNFITQSSFIPFHCIQWTRLWIWDRRLILEQNCMMPT